MKESELDMRIFSEFDYRDSSANSTSEYKFDPHAVHYIGGIKTLLRELLCDALTGATRKANFREMLGDPNPSK